MAEVSALCYLRHAFITISEISVSPLPDSFTVPTGHQQTTAMAFVADSLRNGILSGKIPEGAQLRQDD